MQPIQLFDPASSSYTYLLFDPETTRSSDHRPGRRAARTRPGAAARARPAGWRGPWKLMPMRTTSPALVSWPSMPARARPRPRAATSARRPCSSSTAMCCRFGGEQIAGAAHARPHRRQHVLPLARACLHRRHLACQWLRPHGLPVGQRRGLVPQPDGGPFRLPDETVVWPGHDYQGRSNSTIGAEKAGNARVAGKTLAEFKAIMDELNLPKPRRLDEAVPANPSRACARMRAAEPADPAARLCRQRAAATGLRMVANGRCGAGGRAHRCRARMGRLRARAPYPWPGSSGRA